MARPEVTVRQAPERWDVRQGLWERGFGSAFSVNVTRISNSMSIYSKLQTKTSTSVTCEGFLPFACGKPGREKARAVCFLGTGRGGARGGAFCRGAASLSRYHVAQIISSEALT